MELKVHTPTCLIYTTYNIAARVEFCPPEASKTMCS